MGNSIITKCERYTHIKYTRKYRVIAHLAWNENGPVDQHYQEDLDPQIIFGENSTVDGFVYDSKPPWIGRSDFIFMMSRKPGKKDSGRYEILIYCPWCSKHAHTLTDTNFVDMLTAGRKMAVPEEVICKNCGKPIRLDNTDGSLNSGFHSLAFPVKRHTGRWTSATFFDEEHTGTEGCATIMMHYMITGVNNKVHKLFNKYGAVRISMNMKTGMTYLANGKVYGKDTEKSMRIVNNGQITNITYGGGRAATDFQIAIGGESLLDKINEPEVIKCFAEAMIRYKKIRKEDLTKTGDFSDTTFLKLCLVNAMPAAVPYTDNMEKMIRSAAWSSYNSKAVRKCIRNIRLVFKRGREYAARYYADKKIPKSIRKMILEDPIKYYIYKTLKMSGFKNIDVLRSIIKDSEGKKAVNILLLKENCAEKHVNKKNTFRFLKDMISVLGEKKTVKILEEELTDHGSQYGLFENSIFADAVMMYAALIIQGADKRVLNGKTIREIHDNIAHECEKMKMKNVTFTYTETEKALEDMVDRTFFFLPKNAIELSEASDTLHNCVRSYYKMVLLKHSTIVLMKRDDKLVGCIELDEHKIVRQAYGPCNRYFDKNDNRIFDEWRLRHGVAGLASGRHIGGI